jgi:hypothetical protein
MEMRRERGLPEPQIIAPEPALEETGEKEAANAGSGR